MFFKASIISILIVLTLKHIEYKAKGQLISKCLFEKIVWTKIPTKNLIDSAQQVLVFWSKRFFQKDILKSTDLYKTGLNTSSTLTKTTLKHTFLVCAK